MSLDQSIAGFPLLRLLATGERSNVWLVPGDRVLKVLPAGLHGDEVVALERARGEHAVELLDVGLDDDAAALVFPRLTRGSLAQALSVRAGLDAGEAVTVLAPLAACLARMHAAGVAHGAVAPDNVLFREDGAPMLVGFGRARVFGAGLPEIGLERVEAVLEDRRALTALAVAVLGRVTGPRATAADELAKRIRDGGTDDLEVRLGRELFELAASRPVRLDPDALTAGETRRAVGVTQSPPSEVAEPRPWMSHVERALESGAARVVREFIRDRWSGVSPKRRRLIAGVAAGTLAIVLAVTVVPSAPPPVGATIGAPVPGPSSSGHVALPSEVTGDDPLRALAALLERRTQCFRDLSQLCFDDVDESGSSAWDDDQAALVALESDAVQPAVLTAADATLVERLGDSAIVALAPENTPASLLLLKGEAGWRIRDYIAGAGG